MTPNFIEYYRRRYNQTPLYKDELTVEEYYQKIF